MYITNKREDGFHELETIFYPVDNKTDKIVISPNQTVTTLTLRGADFACDTEKNLCVKAFRLLQKNFKMEEIAIELTKNIPSGAGLGGGSADAAFVLQMLNQLYHLNLTNEELKEYASLLGSDVAFFIDNAPAYATGKGEILQPLDLDLSHKTISVFKPDFSISTAEAYAHVTPQAHRPDLRKLSQLPIPEWKKWIVNNFEKSLFQRYPILQEIKDKFYELGADYASLSGSGSALFAIADFPINLTPFFKGQNI